MASNARREQQILGVQSEINEFWRQQMGQRIFRYGHLTDKQAQWSLCRELCLENEWEWSEEIYGKYPPSTELGGSRAIPFKLFQTVFDGTMEKILAAEADQKAKLARSFGVKSSASHSGSRLNDSPKRSRREAMSTRGDNDSRANNENTTQSSGQGPARDDNQTHTARGGSTHGGVPRGGTARGGDQYVGQGDSQSAASGPSATGNQQIASQNSDNSPTITKQASVSTVQVTEHLAESKIKYWQCYILIPVKFVRVFHAWFEKWIAAENDCLIISTGRLPKDWHFRYLISSKDKSNSRHAYGQILEAVKEWEGSSRSETEMTSRVLEIDYDLNNYDDCISLSDYMTHEKNIGSSKVFSNGRLAMRRPRQRDLKEISEKTGVTITSKSKEFELIRNGASWKQELTHSFTIKSWSAIQVQMAFYLLDEKYKAFAEVDGQLEGWYNVNRHTHSPASSSTKTENTGNPGGGFC